MSRKKEKSLAVPEIAELEQELQRVKYRSRYIQTVKSTVCVLIVVAAMAVLVATLLLPVLQIYGTSMTPTLNEGDIVISVKSSDFEPGDVIAFYYNNKVLCKRLIGRPGDWINIEKDGTVTVNGKPIDEPYVKEKAFGDCNIKLPYQVPESRYFVMGDHRATSVDSRNTAIGCVSEEQIVGKIVFSVWPIHSIQK